MEKTINFGKINFHNTSVRANKVEITIELKHDNDNKTMVLSISGAIWNMHNTNTLMSCQCLDTIATYRDQLNDPELFDKLYMWWKNYHLNNLHAGTPEQEQAIEEWKAKGNKYDFKKVCEYLKSINLYEVPYAGKAHGKIYQPGDTYRYGSNWLIQDIPEEVLNEIVAFMVNN